MKRHAPSGRASARPMWKKLFFRGLILLLPTILTLIILFWCLGLVNEYIIQYVNRGVQEILDAAGFHSVFPDGPVRWFFDWAVGPILSLLFVGLFGLLVGTLLGKRIWAVVESRMTRVPLVRYVYPFIREVTDLVFTDHKPAFRSVVVVQYPRPGLWVLGFLTGNGFEALEKGVGRPLVSVFLPSSPTPMTGYIIFVPAEDVTPLDITVDDAFRLIMSGGVIVPGSRKAVPEDVLQAPPAPLKPSEE